MVRAPCCEKMGLKKGPWMLEEDQVLVSYIHKYGHGNWRALPKQAGLLRCGKSCRLRWTNYLRPDIKRGNFTKEEEDSIIQLHQLLGNRWSAIAARLPGRTDNEIKNVWHTHLKKRLKPAAAALITNNDDLISNEDDDDDDDDDQKQSKIEKADINDQIIQIEDDDHHINPSSPDQQSSTSCNSSSWSGSRSISSSSMSSNDNSTATTNSTDQFDPAEVSLPDEFWIETLSLDNSTTADGSCFDDRFLIDEMSSFDEYRMDNYDVIPFAVDEIVLDPLFEFDQILMTPAFSPLASPSSPSPEAGSVMTVQDLQGHDDHDVSMDFWMNVLMEAGNSQQMNIAGF